MNHPHPRACLIVTLFTLLCAPLTHAAIKSETIEYKHGDTVMEGVLFYDDAAAQTPRPGVLVVHEWWGLNDYAKSRARQLAEMGHVAFAVDMYGKGVRAKNLQECQQFSGVLKADRPTMRGRINAALETLRSRTQVDRNRIAAIGYCFGGTCALELARSGADVKAVVAFHAGLSTPTPATAGGVKAKILVCHGADDPFVPDKELLDFLHEMKAAKADYQVNIYANAVHTFTNPAAGNDPSKGSAYNQQADRRSWEAMENLFAEVLK
jgi:dienelactone hydrolase